MVTYFRKSHATACQKAVRRGFNGLVSEQSVYNLNARTIELEVIPSCRHYALGLIPWSPLAGGLLGGALRKRADGRRGAVGLLVVKMNAVPSGTPRISPRPSFNPY